MEQTVPEIIMYISMWKEWDMRWNLTKYCLSCGILSGLLFPLTTLAKQPVANSIGNIQNDREIQGAGCALQRKGNKGFVFWSTDEKSALMNIDGKDRILYLTSTTADRVSKKGDRSTHIYKAGKIIVRIDRVVTSVCRAGDAECESTSYEGKIKLNIGNRQQIISVTGDCGS